MTKGEASDIIVIPARYSSSRFPGKPLAMIAGKSLIERVWRVASAVKPPVQVVIATDDSRIEEHARSFGAKVVQTSASCRNGSERVHEALRVMNSAPETVINLQGDTPLTPPWALEALLEAMRKNSEIQIATPAVRLTLADHEKAEEKLRKSVSGTYVAISKEGKALYFSRYPIPYIRSDSAKNTSLPFFKHLGIYAYRPAALARYISLPPSPLEELEQLEQLRALEHGIPIHVVEVSLRGRTLVSVDTPEDAREAERIIETQGDVL